eukprot:COSAG02_NODE_4604_length_5175_cov_13.327817_1_plen_399_part_10
MRATEKSVHSKSTVVHTAISIRRAARADQRERGANPAARRSAAPQQQHQPSLRAAASSSAEHGQIRRRIFVPRPGHSVFVVLQQLVLLKIMALRNALLLLLLLLATGAAAQSCTGQADCAVGEYCPTLGSYHEHDDCQTCSRITPHYCDKHDTGCCDAAFLAQCPSNPSGCACTRQADCDDDSRGGSRFCGKYGTCDACKDVSLRSKYVACDGAVGLSGGCCGAAFLALCPADPRDCAGWAPVLRWLGAAVGLLTAVLWVRLRERQLLDGAPGLEPTAAETTEVALDDGVDSQQLLSLRRWCLPLSRGAVAWRAAWVTAAVMSGAVQLDSSDPGRVMAVAEMLGQVFLLWCALAASARICRAMVAKFRMRSCTSRCAGYCAEPQRTVGSRICRGVALPV